MRRTGLARIVTAGAAALLLCAPALAAPPAAPLANAPSLAIAPAPAAPTPGEIATLEPPAPPRPLVQGEEDALRQDAGEYAARYGVSPAVALQRLRAQEESLAETDRLRRLHAGRLAGLFIENRPDFRIVLLLTGSRPVPGRTIMAGGIAVPVEFRTGARATRAELLAALARHAGPARALLPGAQGMGVDPRTGMLVLMVKPEQARRHGVAALEARLEAMTGVSGRIRVIDEGQRDLAAESAAGEAGALEGGARVEGIDTLSGRRNYCTTGFVVTDGARSGVLTAAHCPDALTYFDPAGGRCRMCAGLSGDWRGLVAS